MLALQSNHLNGAIPATLGDLTELTWLDVSFNQLFGSIPVKLSQLPQLTVLDVQSNLLSGNVPSGNISSHDPLLILILVYLLPQLAYELRSHLLCLKNSRNWAETSNMGTTLICVELDSPI